MLAGPNSDRAWTCWPTADTGYGSSAPHTRLYSFPSAPIKVPPSSPKIRLTAGTQCGGCFRRAVVMKPWMCDRKLIMACRGLAEVVCLAAGWIPVPKVGPITKSSPGWESWTTLHTVPCSLGASLSPVSPSPSPRTEPGRVTARH